MGVVGEFYDLMECLNKTNMTEIHRVRNKHDGSVRILKVVQRLQEAETPIESNEHWNTLKNMVRFLHIINRSYHDIK